MVVASMSFERYSSSVDEVKFIGVIEDGHKPLTGLLPPIQPTTGDPARKFPLGSWNRVARLVDISSVRAVRPRGTDSTVAGVFRGDCRSEVDHCSCDGGVETDPQRKYNTNFLEQSPSFLT